MFECKSFYLWLFQVLGLLGLLAFFLWLGFRPESPRYTIVDFSIPSSNYSNATSLVDQGSQNGAALFNLEIDNPNQDSGIYHDDIFMTFYYGPDIVGQKTVTSFYQGKDETRQIADRIEANGQVWKALFAAIRNATAQMDVHLATSIRYRTFGHKSKRHRMNLQGQIRIGSEGKILGKKKKVKLIRASKKWETEGYLNLGNK